MTIPESILEEIRARAKDSWPDDKDMREYFVKEEIDGYRKYQLIDFSGISEKQKTQIIEAAKETYEGWDEIAAAIEDEIEALKELMEYDLSNIPIDLLEQWKKEAEEELKDAKKRIRPENRIEIDIPQVLLPSGKRVFELKEVNAAYNGKLLWKRPVSFQYYYNK